MNKITQNYKAIGHFIGVDSNKTGHLEKLISALGGFLGIAVVVLISQQFVTDQGLMLVVASMGASAVLLFAVPHGPLSQPWPVVAGHTVSALIGVACARWLPDIWLAAAMAVALSIAAMHYLRCIHPPGGATALTAVIGGTSVQQLGFSYLLTPVLLNTVSILFIAVVFNYAFYWRRYPAALAVSKSSMASSEDETDSLREEDLQAALDAMNSTIDISSQDLALIYRLAKQNKLSTQLDIAELKLGHYYSNGMFGADWQVRQIVDVSSSAVSGDSLLIYKVVAGNGRRHSDSCSFSELAKWASYEVELNENSWQHKSVS